MVAPSTALAAVWLKCLYIDAQWLAGLTTIAVRSVSEHAAAAKALFNQVRIHLVMNQVAGRGDLRSGGAIGQVAAIVSRSGVKLQGLQGKFVQMGHVALSKFANKSQYRV